jgi:LysR family transcriptional regulator for bpeEF and oprC
VARLEARLGVRLLERTTRSIGLTVDGAQYYERCVSILRELEDANFALAQARTAPRGRLRVDAPTVLGRYVIVKALPRFLEQYPELSVELSVRDHLIDPIAEGIDVVVRVADLRESELVHKKLGMMRFMVVGAPQYLARRGRPKQPADLRAHDLLGFLSSSGVLPWRFRTKEGEMSFTPAGRLLSNDRDALREATLKGLGLSAFLEIHVSDAIRERRLEVVLAEHEMPGRPTYALYTRDKARLPKVRAFLSLLEECFRGPSGAWAPSPGAVGAARSKLSKNDGSR